MLRRLPVLLPALAALAAFALIAAGCGSEGDATAGEPEAKTEAGTSSDHGADSSGENAAATGGGMVKVKLGEWFIKPMQDSVPAGKVNFKVKNVGSVEHEFVIVRTDKAAGKLPVSDSVVDLEASGEVAGGAHAPEKAGGGAKEHDSESHLMPGMTASYNVDLKPGNYVLLCNIVGHYEAGQSAEFKVE